MKQTISLAIIMMLAISGVFAKNNKEQKGTLTTVKGTNVSVTYEQVSKNGRVIFGKPEESPVMSYGNVWNEPIDITLTKDCLVGGNKRPLKAGAYTLLINPHQGEWVLSFNPDLNHSTAATFSKNDPKVITSWGITTHLNSSVEKFTVEPQKDGLLIEWDQISVLFPIEFVNK